MKNFKLGLVALLGALSIISCSSDAEDVLGSGNNGADENTPTIRITEGGATDDIFVATATGEAGTIVQGRVIFTTTDSKQRRLYVTKSEFGSSAEPIVIEELSKKGTKADGSIDLDGDTKKTLDFVFDLDVPTDANGEIIYNFWSTTGKGDFRDASKRLLLGVGEITVKVGTGNNPDAAVRSFTDVKLFAPALDGSTKTFFSLLDGKTHRIDEGDEYRALWDFGYYYGASGISKDQDATLVSSLAYNDEFTDDPDLIIKGLRPDASEGTEETLNKGYFAISSKNLDEFKGVSISGDLDFIDLSSGVKVSNLKVGDIIEFVDNYKNKGLIYVKQIEPGFNTNDFIVIDIKVQPSNSFDGKKM